jgi:phytanoyl-CoA hydroxylase
MSCVFMTVGQFLRAANTPIKTAFKYSTSTFNAYKYTLNNSVFDTNQRDFYEKNGFVLIKKLVSQQKLDKFKLRFQEICAKKEKIPGMTIMKDVAIAKSEFVDGEKAITKIQDFCFDDELFKYCCAPEIVDYVKAFVGENVQAMHTMLINKPPGN